MVRDEEEFVEEFVEYHTLIGVQHVNEYYECSIVISRLWN